MAVQGERLNTELELLHSIYPDRIKYHDKGRELSYTDEAASLKLRLPDGYLQDALPEVISASASKTDVRNEFKQSISSLIVGEEVLDSIFLSFNELCERKAAQLDKSDINTATPTGLSFAKATIIVWLHHLLNTNKRKQCLNPPSSVSGITKPGYPGVLIYSGPSQAVYEHVNELKGLNWAAFQVRLESEEEWSFRHGDGVVELEAMKDVVADIGDQRKELFLESMRMK